MRCCRRCSLALRAYRERCSPVIRNEFHAGLQQAVGKNVVFSGEYIWKYTHNAFDFSVLGNTPITFPIDWHNSKIPGYALARGNAQLPRLQRLSCHVVGGCALLPAAGGRSRSHCRPDAAYPFRIDHDEKFNETTHLQYTVSHDGSWFNGLWGGFNWRYDSGLVPARPCYAYDPNSSAQRRSPCQRPPGST